MKGAARAAIYVRVSTDHEEQKLSPENQISRCREHAAELGLDISDPALIYNDAGMSGTEMINRPEVQRLVADARFGRFEVVIFTAISRFARDMADVFSLKKTLETWGIRIISVEELYDSAIPERNSEVLFTLHAMMAAQKSIEMSKAIRRGLRESAKKGRHIGNVKPYGYRQGEDQHLVPDSNTKGVVSEIYDMYFSGLGSRAIATKLNRRGIPAAKGGKWQSSSVNAILRNPVYIGKIVATKRRKAVDVLQSRILNRRVKTWQTRHKDDWVVVDGGHEALIDIERWNAVQQMLDTKKQNKAVKRSTGNLLAGLMRCGECGGAMCVRTSRTSQCKKRYRYIACLAVGRVSKEACCNHFKHHYDEILNQVIMPFRHIAIEPDLQVELAKRFVGGVAGASWGHRGQEVQKALDKNKKRQLKLVQMLADENNPFNPDVLSEYYAELRAEQERLTMELSEVAAAREQHAELLNRTKEIGQIVKIFDHLDQFDTVFVRTSLSTLIGRITFYADGRVEVDYQWSDDSYTPVSECLM